MDNTTDLPGTQAPGSATLAAGAKKRQRQLLLVSAFILWVIGVITVLVAAVIILFFHPGPWPFDLQTTVTLQSIHYSPWLLASIDIPSRFNDIIPATIALTLWLVGLLLIGWIFKQRGKSPMHWIVTALFIVFGTLFADLAINGLISRLVNRPRPSPLLIHVYNPEPVPSFPSGHVEHTVVYYGFLLYLSFTKPVREWRYHWLLLPLQIFAALNILMIGYSRVEEGSHWLSDALAGYLEGAFLLALLIFVYGWTLKRLEERRTKRLVEQPAMATQAHHTVGETMRAKTLESVQVVEKKSLESVQVVEKKAKPYEELFIKSKEDWIHHLAQALAFSLLLSLIPIAILLLSIFGRILGILDIQTQQILTGQLDAIIPSPLSSQATQVFSQAYDTFSHASAIVVVFTFVLAVLLGSFLFSLMEACFDVIFHLPPRPFLHRHIVALGMLCLYIALAPIIIVASAAPALTLSLLHVIPPGNIPASNLIFRLASIGGSIILSLILFEALYVVVPHRHVTLRTLGRHIRNSWRGALVATITLQLLLQLFPLYATFFLRSYIGQLGFVLVLLLYFYLFTLILMFGAEVNAFFAEGIRVPLNDLITQASKDSFR